MLLTKTKLIAAKFSKNAYLIIKSQIRNTSTNEKEWNDLKLRTLKRLFSFTLFGGTLATAWFLRKKKRNDFKEFMQNAKLLNDDQLGDVKLYQLNNKFIIPEPVVKIWKKLKSFKFRQNDIVLIAFPKTGVTWVQEAVWLLNNDLNYDSAKRINITERVPFLEFPSPGISTIEKIKDQRLIKTHLPPSLLFDNETYEKPKVIIIFRNPKDVLVSYYHFSRMNNMIGYKGSFDDFFLRFVKGVVPYGPFWEHFNDCSNFIDNQNRNNHYKIHVVFYENLKLDFQNEIDKLCDFIGREKLTDEEMATFKQHCSFDEMRLNSSVNYKHWDDLGLRDKSETPFMRKGQIGDWVNYFTVGQNAIMNKVIQDKLTKTLNFRYN